VYGGIFTTGIFRNFYTEWGGEFLTSRTGIPGGLASCISASAMHDITQLWGMCIIGKERRRRRKVDHNGAVESL